MSLKPVMIKLKDFVSGIEDVGKAIEPGMNFILSILTEIDYFTEYLKRILNKLDLVTDSREYSLP